MMMTSSIMLDLGDNDAASSPGSDAGDSEQYGSDDLEFAVETAHAKALDDANTE